MSLAKMSDFSSEKVRILLIHRTLSSWFKEMVKKDEHYFSLSLGEYKILVNISIVNICRSFYMYNASQDNLILDSNYDGSYGPDSMVYLYNRIK